MKFGMRKPSIKKSFKARTTGRLKRSVKKAVNPFYGKKGIGFLKNPVKSIKDSIYKKTTFSFLDLFRVSKKKGGKKKNAIALENREHRRKVAVETVENNAEQKQLKAQLAAQDAQIKAVQDAEDEYKKTKDAEKLILFWEDIWNNGGVIFNGAYWTFRLPDLYIKLGRYDDAIKILNMITNPFYTEKRQKYLEKISALKTRNKESK